MCSNSNRAVGSYGGSPCIVGMACRLPGKIRSPCGLWEFLMRKGCAQGPVPAQRFNREGFYQPDSRRDSRAGLMDVDGGYFLDGDVRAFDNAFFGIHNLEAASMDPQQRKLLEIVFECLEHAGATLDQVSGSNTGVFVGNFTLDHQTMQSRDVDAIHRFSATGCGTSILANRISHVFNLHGPSFTLDTACSSALYAVHSAVSALEVGDCDAAVVAAVNLIMSPEQSIAAAKNGVLSPTSTCHTFDAAADGYGRAEGMNAIYIKRFSDAVEHGDKIWAVIRGSAVNANGKTHGITQPSAGLQESVIRKAYLKAGLDFADCDYVECHGTGTTIGDPIEVEALGRCFTGSRRDTPLLIGSCKKSKPGLGHSEAASGLTAVIKVALSLDHGKIAPTCGVKNLNPKLRLGSFNMKVATEVEPWPRDLRTASINAFGYGGANAHVILESADRYLSPERQQAQEQVCSRELEKTFVLPVSAASSKALQTRMSQVRHTVESGNANTLDRLAYTLTERMSHLGARDVLLAKCGPNKKPELLHLDKGVDNVQTMGPPFDVALVFTGQGAQYAGMGKELLLQNECFLASIRGLDRSLKTLLSSELVPQWSIESGILDTSQFHRIHLASRSQPVCTAIQIALVDLLRSWHVNPCAVVGHSSGEIAAAYAAGLLSASQAIIVAYLRGYAVDMLAKRGAMLAAGISVDVANDLIQQVVQNHELSIACINSPQSVTLSGSVVGIELLMSEIKRRGLFARKLDTGDIPYHSPTMEEVGEFYETLLAPYLDFKDKHNDHGQGLQIPMYSSVSSNGENKPLILTSDCVSASYWRRNLEKPVQFSSALSELLGSQKKVHLAEVGPNPALKAPIKQIIYSLMRDTTAVPYSYTLVQGQDADLCMKQLACSFFLRGHILYWQNVNYFTSEEFLHDLPPYPWDYSAGLLWQEPRASTELRNRRYARHELLGSQQVGGNGMDCTWRNVLSLTEVPWIRDHRLESQIVFPASCYLAMAIEALRQSRTTSSGSPSAFEFRHINISTALIIPDHESKGGVELHTRLSPRELSGTSVSEYWNDFSISSFSLGLATVHCSGKIRTVSDSEYIKDAETITIDNTGGFDEWPNMTIWYDRFTSEGLRFGPSFQSVIRLRTDSGRSRCEAMSTTRLVPDIEEGVNERRYPLHPITIDACIQVAIMGSAGGDLKETHVYLPVAIEQCSIRAAAPNDFQKLGLVKATSSKTSLSTRMIKSSLWSTDALPVPLALMKGVRVTQYKANVIQKPPIPRQPCLQICWKPDIGHINGALPEHLDRYVASFVAKCRKADMDLADDECLAAIVAVVDLAGHKNPNIRILQLGDDCRCKSKEIKDLLGAGSGFQRFKSWQSGRLDESGALQLVDRVNNDNVTLEGPFDVVLVHNAEDICDSSNMFHSLVADQGIVVARGTTSAMEALRNSQLNIVEISGGRVILASPVPETENISTHSNDIIIVVQNPSSVVMLFAEGLKAHLQLEGGFTRTQILTLHGIRRVGLRPQTICISLLELEDKFLASMDQREMDSLRNITNSLTTVLWLSGANALGNKPNPDLAFVNGLSRALMLEQPALNFNILDVGITTNGDSVTYQNVLRVLKCRCRKNNAGGDKEFIQKDGLLYISRFSPEFNINAIFCRRFEKQDAIVKAELSVARPAKLAIGTSGASETIHFEQVREPTQAVPDGFIDVLVKAVSLNAKDVYALRGRVDTRGGTTALEFSGVVTAVGPDIAHLQRGDDVVVAMPCHLATSQRVPAWAAYKMMPGEQYTVMATLPTIYGTAYYALAHRARLRTGESVLIHGGAGAFGFAAITLAKHMLGSAANIYTTTRSQPKRIFIADQLGVPEANIFDSRKASFAAEIRVATRGHGVDVVVNFLTGDLLRETWECVAPFGRFVEIGKRDLIDAGRLDMHVFLRNATFTAFDFSDLYYQQAQFNDDTFSSLLKEVFILYRSSRIQPPPMKIFAASEVVEAYRYFSSEDRLGKVVISFQQEDGKIPLAPSRYLTLFHPQKVYLLVGCLGGLGRSLSRWMSARGARNFVFLGRSGCHKPSAWQLVARLEDQGAKVKVVQGDVAILSDVQSAVSACSNTGCSIGGVVQAAMGLHEALFAQMAIENWQAAIHPKWKGTWNLHKALEGRSMDLDFFLLTSSLSGSVGTATESNYCAANSFMDAFAHWRRAQGQPATSLGLGMISDVGYLHENPEIEALLLRKGIHPLSEAEFLQVVDLALARDAGNASAKDDNILGTGSAHMLTGLEPDGFRQLRNRGFDVNFSSAQDPRLAILSAAFASEQNTPNKRLECKRVHAAEWFSNIPNHAAVILAPEADAESPQIAILTLIRKRFSSLILTPVSHIDDGNPLARVGIDSMTASEFRTWLWTAFEVDVPLLDILSPNKSLSTLAELIQNKLLMNE